MFSYCVKVRKVDFYFEKKPVYEILVAFYSTEMLHEKFIQYVNSAEPSMESIAFGITGAIDLFKKKLPIAILTEGVENSEELPIYLNILYNNGQYTRSFSLIKPKLFEDLIFRCFLRKPSKSDPVSILYYVIKSIGGIDDLPFGKQCPSIGKTSVGSFNFLRDGATVSQDIAKAWVPIKQHLIAHLSTTPDSDVKEETLKMLDGEYIPLKLTLLGFVLEKIEQHCNNFFKQPQNAIFTVNSSLSSLVFEIIAIYLPKSIEVDTQDWAKIYALGLTSLENLSKNEEEENRLNFVVPGKMRSYIQEVITVENAKNPNRRPPIFQHLINVLQKISYWTCRIK